MGKWINHMENISFKIITEVREGDIEQIVLIKDLQGYYKQVCRNIYYIKEKQLKEALIQLGWTPPEEKE